MRKGYSVIGGAGSDSSHLGSDATSFLGFWDLLCCAYCGCISFYVNFLCSFFLQQNEKVMSRRALVFGSNGALGKDVVAAFTKRGWGIFAVDISGSACNLPFNAPVAEQQEMLLKATENQQFDAIVNVAGGWAGGNAADKDMAANAELMVKQSINSATISTYLGTQRGKEKLLLVHTGSAAALNPTSFMLGYGLAKAGVHHFIKSVASDPSLLPKGAAIIGILPNTLDTPGNRAGMPDADRSTWTPTDVTAEKIAEWAEGKNRPNSGDLIVLQTLNGQTQFIPK